MQRLASFFVRIFEYAMPDPYIFAVGLTILTAILALIFAPHRDLGDILDSWYMGIFDIFTFALQMILILVTGYALAQSRPVARALEWLASLPRTTGGAVTLTILVSAAACFLNWGFGLVVAGLLARTIAMRMRIDFGWLVAAAYSGFVIWASGLSSSIALAQATPGSKLNLTQQLAGVILPLHDTVFAPFNLVPVVVMVALLPVIFNALEPKGDDVIAADPSRLASLAESDVDVSPRDWTLASRLENAWILNLVPVLAGVVYLGVIAIVRGITLDINLVIFTFFMLGLLLHWRPIAYVRAVNRAARITGPLLIQYPLYGGIMGIMTTTGLAGVVAQWFLAFSTTATLPFWQYVASVIISLFVPSGGGHWAVQGPFAVPAALKLHASLPGTAMGVAMGEQVANMIQPFWALPILAIAGIGLRRVMAYTALVFFVAFAVFGLSLLVLLR